MRSGVGGSAGVGPICGGTRASAAGWRATISSSVRPSARSWATSASAIDAPVVTVTPSIDEEAGQHLVGVEGGEGLLGVAEDGEQLVVAEVVEVVDVGQVGRRPRSRGRARSPAWRRGAGRCAMRPAAGAPGAGGRGGAGSSAPARRHRAPRGRPRRGPSTSTSEALGERPVADGAADPQGFTDAVLERRLPEVALERAERGGERLGDGPGPEQVAALGRQRRRGDGPALEQAERGRRARSATPCPAARRRAWRCGGRAGRAGGAGWR